MKRFTFKKQMHLAIAIFLLASLLSFILHKGFFFNIAWIIYGLIFIENPVYPEFLACRYAPEKLEQRIRIAGVICIVIGLISRFGV